MRRTKWPLVAIVALCLLVTAVAIAYAAGKTAVPVQEVVRAKRFELVDERGKVRATLRVTVAGTELGLRDDESRVRIALRVPRGGDGGLVVLDEEGDVRVILGTTKGRPSLILADDRGKAFLNVSNDHAPELSLFDEKGERVRLTAANGRPGLLFFDPEGYIKLAISTSAEGAMIVIQDRDANPRAGLALLPDGTVDLSLYDKNGKVLWKAP